MKRKLHSRRYFAAVLAAATTIISLPPTGEGATVSVNWGGVDSRYFDDEREEPCQYEGRIVLSHPMSIDFEDTHYVLGSLMLKAAQMTVDKINMYPRCGVSLAGGKNYSIALQTYGDQSDQNKTERIGQKIATDNRTDFMLAGYSSHLTSILTPIAQEHQKICLTGGSSRTSVHADKDYVFGLNPPSGAYLESVFSAAKAQGAETVAYLAEESTDPCGGAEGLADKYGMQLVSSASIPEFAPLESYIWVAKEMAVVNPDLMITCVRTRHGEWNQAMRHVNWTPKAQAYTYVGGTGEFERALGPVDLPYVMAISGWDSALPPIPDAATGWTPQEFDAAFEQAAFRHPYYQQVQQSAVISVLTQAIERVGAFSGQNATDQIRDVLADGYFSTVYGNVSFDMHGQNKAPFLLLQYDASATLHILLPEDKHHTDFEMVYPLPTWANRDCVGLSSCEELGGTCSVNGACDCPAHLVAWPDMMGANATCYVPTLASQIGSHVYVLGTVLPFLVAVVVGWIVYRHARNVNDASWQIKKEELKFDDPPKKLGSGTFGEVLLAEYRGTNVAVKRVLPSKDESTGLIEIGMKKFFGRLRRHFSVRGDKAVSRTPSCSHSSLISHNNRPSDRLSGLRSGHRGSSSFGKLKANFVNEMRMVSRLRHPCISTIMGAVMDPSEEPMLVMEYMSKGSLKDLLANETMFIDGEMLLTILKDIAQGCNFLHKAKPQVIHGDLKAENILIDDKLTAKVSDFGLSQKKCNGGSPFFMAPELLNQSSYNTAATDVYSFGIIIYEVYARKSPYEDDDDDFHDILRQIADPSINKRPPVPDKCPPQVASLMCDCLLANPEDRPTFQEIDQRLQRIGASAMKVVDDMSRHSHSAKMPRSVSLFDLFPTRVAEALRDGKPVEAEHKDSVTLFFSDIVGFTNISSKLEPRKIANMLDRLYSKLDALSQKHDIFKVETIGDAYMAVTNLVKDQPDSHATRIANFAVDAVKAANETLIDMDDASMGHVNIRVGFHTGPVVADVVGSKNPRYCLFGDSVNTASRMESNSKQNRIHCSQAACDQLRREHCPLPIVSRGVIQVKGKGRMKTYWINEDGPPEAVDEDVSEPTEHAIMSSRSFSNHHHHHDNQDLLVRQEML